MKVFWEVEDGYCGKHRPQSTEVNDALLDACENDEEREEMIEQCVQEDFEQKTSWLEIRREK